MDLSKEQLPEWPFSCYGPGKDAPLQLFGGQPREASPEEFRLRFYELASQGRIPEAKGEEDSMRVTAQQQVQKALSDLRGAVRYIRDGANKHPNRFDVIAGRAQNENQDGFGGAEAKQTGAFGRMTATPNAGNPFGQPSTPSSNPFLKPPQQANPFAKPGDVKPNPFARPGDSQSTSQNGGFGQASNPFARPGDQKVPGPFEPGAPQNPFNRNAPGNAPAFAPNNPTTNTTNPFSRNPVVNPFTNTIAHQRQTGAFNQNSAFPTSSSSNGFPPPPSASGSSPAEPSDEPPALGPDRFSILDELRPNAPNNPAAREFRNGKLVRFRNCPVAYQKLNEEQADSPIYPFFQDEKKEVHRIWNEATRETPGAKGDSGPLDPTEDLYDQGTVDGLRFMVQNGVFKDGVMPLLPLPLADVTFDI